MNAKLHTIMGLIALLLSLGCSQRHGQEEQKDLQTAVSRAQPLPSLLEELENLPPPDLPKKHDVKAKEEFTANQAPKSLDDNALNLRLAELSTRKECCQYSVEYSQYVLRYIQRHEENFIASWNPRDADWAGPIDTILDGYRRLKSECQKKNEDQRAELQRVIAEWEHAKAELKKRKSSEH